MAYLEPRKRKHGATVYLLRWTDKTTGLAQNQKYEDRKDAEFLLAVLKAHDQDTQKALSSAQDYYGGIYTVTKMIEKHISMLTNADGYTVRRYEGHLRTHIRDSLGVMDALDIEYGDIVAWAMGLPLVPGLVPRRPCPANAASRPEGLFGPGGAKRARSLRCCVL